MLVAKALALLRGHFGRGVKSGSSRCTRRKSITWYGTLAACMWCKYSLHIRAMNVKEIEEESPHFVEEIISNRSKYGLNIFVTFSNPSAASSLVEGNCTQSLRSTVKGIHEMMYSRW